MAPTPVWGKGGKPSRLVSLARKCEPRHVSPYSKRCSRSAWLRWKPDFLSSPLPPWSSAQRPCPPSATSHSLFLLPLQLTLLSPLRCSSLGRPLSRGPSPLPSTPQVPPHPLGLCCHFFRGPPSSPMRPPALGAFYGACLLPGSVGGSPPGYPTGVPVPLLTPRDPSAARWPSFLFSAPAAPRPAPRVGA